MTVYTLGHSTHTEEAFIALLKQFGVDLLIDVRSLPGSNYVPQFNKGNMELWLPEAKIDYLHMPLLVGRRNKNHEIDPAYVSGWRNASFRNYAGHTFTKEYKQGIEELKELMSKHTICLMCSEAVPWRCHRLIISNTLVADDIPVEHIISENNTIAYQFGQYGALPVLRSDGLIVYPKIE